LIYTLNKTPPFFYWSQAAPTRYRDRSHCVFFTILVWMREITLVKDGESWVKTLCVILHEVYVITCCLLVWNVSIWMCDSVVLFVCPLVSVSIHQLHLSARTVQCSCISISALLLLMWSAFYVKRLFLLLLSARFCFDWTTRHLGCVWNNCPWQFKHCLTVSDCFVGKTRRIPQFNRKSCQGKPFIVWSSCSV